ncbi:transposase [Novosphingobium chloroacetimidivorans]|uniref:Transposase n=1 Tax=Novosphingobium chloroacetimidivorans TaxID=1428314 RepID=A0A7W7KER7_9SPHN|nr:IS110 family transposase [Novosphingobium chloroacetimidivorans]MBB4861165.1 transposase [Novosphingobium chloroacetimidivorans]
MSISSDAAVSTQLNAIFVSLELSRSTWLVTSLSPGRGERLSRHQVKGGDVPSLLNRFAQLQARAEERTGEEYPLVVIQEAGLDGFWIHRCLTREGIESHVVDAASIAASWRSRRAKTDKLDGEALVRTLLAYKRGEPRVCAMVAVPSVEDEDRRRICRERRSLVVERIRHINRVKGLLFAQGVGDYEPLRANRRSRLEELTTGDGRPLPSHIKREIERELDRLELVMRQIKEVERERDAMLEAATQDTAEPASARLLQLRGIGPEFAAVLHAEAFFRSFSNRRQVACYAGLAPSPWQSGAMDREQGVSKAGNKRLRTMMIQVAWLWLRHQPTSELTRWFEERVQTNGGRVRRVMIVALARKLLISLWQFSSAGVVPKGALLKPA